MSTIDNSVPRSGANPSCWIDNGSARRSWRWLLMLVPLAAGVNVAYAKTCVQATPGSYQWQNVALPPQADIYILY